MEHVLPTGVVTVTFTHQGRSFAYSVKLDEAGASMLGDHIILSGMAMNSGYLDGIDKRLDNQRKSIDGLLSHLKVHCPRLRGEGSCSHGG